MARFALIRPDNSVDRLASNVDPSVATKPGYKWLPCDQVAPPTFDPAAELVTGPAYTVGASAVVEVWTKRNLTAQEISDRKDTQIGGIDRVLGAMLFDMANQVRVLQAQPPLTKAQFLAWAKSKIGTF